jgi:hypothetical protein
MLGWACRIRYTTASVGPVPNGSCPLAANVSVTAQAKMSAAGPTCIKSSSGKVSRCGLLSDHGVASQPFVLVATLGMGWFGHHEEGPTE